MSDIAHHLVRRAVDATNQHYSQSPNSEGQDGPEIKKIALWGMILLWATAILYIAMVSAIEYTYGNVVTALAMIETPTATAFKTASTDEDSTEVDAPLLSEDQKDEKAQLKAMETDLFLVKQPPITAKLRTAVKHLRHVAGPFARFRGLHIALIYHAIHGAIVGFFAPGPGAGLIRPLISIITTVALCRIQMTWTHVVISNPTSKAWYRRFPTAAAGKNIIIPTAVFAIAQQAALYVPVVLYMSVLDQFDNVQAYGGNIKTAQKIALVELLCVFVISISTLVLIVIPAQVTLTRVQASMLPEQDEAIVPFDRTFAGKVKPEILGGSGCIGMLDAWRTFDRAGRIRLIKLYAKVLLLETTTTIFFVMIIIGELRLIMGDDFKKLVEGAKNAIKHHG